MLPQLPDEVWTMVLEKLKAVVDFGRLQQVSRTFNAIVADVCWTKIKIIKMFQSEDRKMTIFIFLNEQKLLLPMEKRLLLLAELAKKATKITVVSLNFHPCHEALTKEFGETVLVQEYLEFLRCALGELKAAPMEIRNFEVVGDLVQLTPLFPSLAQFIDANTKTMQKLSICDVCFNAPDCPYRFQVPPELLQAIQGCSQLESATLSLYFHLFNDAILENVLSGKSHLTRLFIYGQNVPVHFILDLETQLVEFGCSGGLLWDYVEELGLRGLMVTDPHPLLTIKDLSVERGVPSFSLLPNLEQLKCRGQMDVEYDVVPLVSDFLTQYMDTVGAARVLMCNIETLTRVITAQKLADKVQQEFFCQTTVKTMEYNSGEIVFSHGNASVVCRVADFPVNFDWGSDSDEW